jgi:hypothetical protein
MKVTGSAACTATSDDAQLSGKVTITMSETYTDPKTGNVKPYQIQAYLRRSPGVDPTSPDISLYQGTVLKGLGPNSVGLGSTIVGTLFEDPIVKAVPATTSPTGYVGASALLTQCKAGSATISTVEIGAGTSMFGGIASGLHFGY